MKIRAAVLAVATILALTPGAQAGQSIAQAPALTRVRLALLATPGSIHIAYWLAKEQGLFARQGLEVEFLPVDATPAGLAAVTAGSAQFTFTGSNLPDAVVAGLPVVAIHASANVPVAEICALRSIVTVKDMIGKTVALNNRGSSPDVTFRIWLEKQGLTDQQVTIRNFDAGIPAMVAAAVAGAVQIFAVNPPRCSLYEANGFRPFSDLGTTDNPFFNAGVAVGRDYLAGNRDVVRRFLAALVAARRLFQSDKDVAIATIKSLDKIDNQATAESVWEFMKARLANPPLVSREAMLQSARYSTSQATRERGPAMVDAMYDNSVLEEALAR